MSDLLEAAACREKWRAEALARDAEMAEREAIAADLLEHIGKAERRFGVSYRCAVEDQVLNVDAFRRAGWI